MKGDKSGYGLYDGQVVGGMSCDSFEDSEESSGWWLRLRYITMLHMSGL